MITLFVRWCHRRPPYDPIRYKYLDPNINPETKHRQKHWLEKSLVVLFFLIHNHIILVFERKYQRRKNTFWWDNRSYIWWLNLYLIKSNILYAVCTQKHQLEEEKTPEILSFLFDKNIWNKIRQLYNEHIFIHHKQ